MIKIGILYICTGKYDVFWKEFYESCEEYFCNDCEKHYFVFTDAEKIAYENESKRIHKFFQENLGWPDNTLKRFHIFLKQEKEIEETDYLFFFNANCKFVSEIKSEEFLPKKEKLLFVQHPGYWNKQNKDFPYERSTKSTAYIPKKEGKYYVCGGVNGGITLDFINLMKELKKRIDIDYSNGIIAKWHDESQINRYVYELKDYKILPPSYCFQPKTSYDKDTRIIVREKSDYIDVVNIKNKSFFQKFKDKLYRFLKG